MHVHATICPTVPQPCVWACPRPPGLRGGTVRLADAEHVLDGVGPARLQPLEARLDGVEPPGQHLVRLRLEPALQKPARKVAEVHVAKVAIALVHTADVGDGLLHMCRHVIVRLPRQYERDLAAVGENLADVDVAAVLRHGVVRVQELPPPERLPDPRHHGLVAVAVVDDGVALAAVLWGLASVLARGEWPWRRRRVAYNEAFDVRARLARHANQRVDVASLRELDGIGPDGRRRSVHDQRQVLRGRPPGLRQPESEVQPEGRRHGRQGNGRRLCRGWKPLVSHSAAATGEGTGQRPVPSKLIFWGMWNVVCWCATAYSAYDPPGASISWKAATRSPAVTPSWRD